MLLRYDLRWSFTVFISAPPLRILDIDGAKNTKNQTPLTGLVKYQRLKTKKIIHRFNAGYDTLL